MRIRVPLTALLVGLVLVTAACAGRDEGGDEPEPTPGGGRETVLAELEANRGLWEESGIESYRLTVGRVSFLPPEFLGPFVVTVENGEVVGVVRKRTGEAPREEHVRGMPLTVEDLFDVIEEFADADSIEVRYKSDLGYPTRIEADPEFNAIDEEFSFFVRGFRASD